MSAINNFPFYNGLGTPSKSGILPNQFLPESQKKDSFKKRTMDSLESIALSQMAENIKFRDFYKMTEGNLVYSDYGIEEGGVLDKIKELGDRAEIPTFVKHYDFIGIIVNQLVGEYLGLRDNFTVGSTDEISENEFIRERTDRVAEFAEKATQIEIRKRLVQKGINPDQQEFTSEEEQQQYLQMLDQERAKLIDPSRVELDMQKNWKTKAAEWAEHVLENDQERFYMDTMDANEMKDYLLTGRFFRHYYIGYDYYKPERWSPIETFFSKDVEAEYPQDGEYAGRITYKSPSDIVKRWGHLMKPSDIKKLNTGFNSDLGGSSQETTIKGILGKHFTEPQTIPYGSYYENELALQMQSVIDEPMGEYLTKDKEGNDIRIPTWLSPDFGHNYSGYKYSSVLRDDIDTRSDLLQVTEAYFRSWKRMWFLNYTTPEGIPSTTTVTDEILSDFIKDNEIKKITTKSIEDMVDKPENNTMYEFWIPEIWKGIKINNSNSFLTEPIYLDVAPLPYQIKGDSNVFDVKLPVGGIINSSMAQKLRPYQVGYNICLNQIFNFLEKEIGAFFLFDINFLPSEYKDVGDSEEALLKLRDLAQSVGIVPLDTKKQNLEGANPQMNVFQSQSITYDVQVKNRIELANWYQSKALEQIGITPQRLGNPGAYETATGIEQGTKASYTQTESIFGNMAVARRKTMELHLSIAQYCQKEYLDVDMVFTKSDGDKQFLNLSDKDFPLRRLGLIPINNSKMRRELERLRDTLLQTNTLGNDMLDYAELFSADTMAELIAIGRKGRLEKQKEIEAQRAHEQELVDKQLMAAAEQKELDRVSLEDSKQKDRIVKLQEAQIEAFGRAADKESDQAGLNAIERFSQIALNEQDLINKDLIENRKLDAKSEENKINSKFQFDSLNLKMKELQQKDRKMNNDRYIATVNKN